MGFLRTIPALLLLLAPGCGSFRPGMGDSGVAPSWVTEGRTMERTHSALPASVEPPRPPFEVLWTAEVSAGFGPSPGVTYGGTLLVADLQGDVHAFSVDSGSEAGEKNFGRAVCGSPALDAGKLILAVTDGKEGLIRAYDLGRGEILWDIPAGDAEASPLVADGRVVIAETNGKIRCLGEADGRLLWSLDSAPSGSGCVLRSSPASDGAIVVFGSDLGILTAARLQDGTPLWSAETHGAVTAAVSCINGRVFCGTLDSAVSAFDASTGQLLWREILDGKIYAPLAVSDGRLHAVTAAGSVYAFEATTGVVLWERSGRGICSAAPVVSGGMLYVADEKGLLSVFDSADGTLLGEYNAGRRLQSSPILVGGTVVLFGENGMVTALRGPRP